MKKRWSSKYTFWALLLLFLTPFIAASWLYAHAYDFHIPTKNKGQLVQPTAHFSALHLEDTDHKPLAFNTLEGSWWIVVLNEGACENACKEQLYWMNQLHTALHKNSHRVRRLVSTTSLHTDFLAWAHAQYPDLVVAQMPQIPTFLPAPGIVLMDPMGNIMLYYPLETDPNAVFKDLKLMLRHSQIG